jgi:hypothetical protein
MNRHRNALDFGVVAVRAQFTLSPIRAHFPHKYAVGIVLLHADLAGDDFGSGRLDFVEIGVFTAVELLAGAAGETQQG